VLYVREADSSTAGLRHGDTPKNSLFISSMYQRLRELLSRSPFSVSLAFRPLFASRIALPPSHRTIEKSYDLCQPTLRQNVRGNALACKLEKSLKSPEARLTDFALKICGRSSTRYITRVLSRRSLHPTINLLRRSSSNHRTAACKVELIVGDLTLIELLPGFKCQER